MEWRLHNYSLYFQMKEKNDFYVCILKGTINMRTLHAPALYIQCLYILHNMRYAKTNSHNTLYFFWEIYYILEKISICAMQCTCNIKICLWIIVVIIEYYVFFFLDMNACLIICIDTVFLKNDNFFSDIWQVILFLVFHRKKKISGKKKKILFQECYF